MRLFLFFLFICLGAHGASYTSSQDGPWSATATWGGAAVPGDGDTVIIRHTVTVDTDTIVGASPSTTTATGTPAIDIQDTSTAGYDGHLMVPNGVTLTVRGNLRGTSTGAGGEVNKARLTVQPGGAFVFDNTQAPSNGTGKYNFYSNANGNEMIVTFGSPGVTSPRAVFRGKPEGSSGGNSLFINNVNQYSWARVGVYGTDIYDCGSASEPCLKTYEYNTNSGTINVWDTDFVRTGGIEVRIDGTNSASTSQTWIFRRVRTLNSLSTLRSIQTIHRTTVKTGGTREISDCYFDKGVNGAMFGQFDISRTAFVTNFHPTGIANSSLYWNSFSNILIYMTSTTASGSYIGGDMKDVYFIAEGAPSVNNPHGLFVNPALRRDITFDGIIGEYTHPGAAVTTEGEFLGASWCTTPDQYAFTIKNSIVLPHSISQTIASYAFITWNVGSTFTPCSNRLEHNTIMGGPIKAGAGVMYGEGSGVVPSGLIDSYKSNIFWDTTPRITAMHYLPGQGESVDMFDPAQVTHNANYNYVNTSAVYPAPNNHCNGTPYQSACTSAPGAHDVNGKNPRFVDISRNFSKWTQANHSGDGSTAAAVSVFASTPAAELGDRIISLLSYVREGFRPQNPAYRTAAHDGTTIGAVPMAPAPRHFGTINNPVVVE